MPTLLLADDNLTVQRVIELTFSRQDIQVVTVTDGEQAIERIRAERPDIVLADIGIPQRNGYDVCAFVTGTPELADIPVLLLAGAFEPVDAARAEQVRCSGVLVKPFDPQQLVVRVRELMGGIKGAPTRIVAEVPRPVERLAPLKLVETPRRDPAPSPATPPAPSVVPSPVVAFPEPERALRATEPPRDGELDDYFDRLDAAFAGLDARAPDAKVRPQELADIEDGGDQDLDLPTLDQLLGHEQPTATPSASRGGTGAARPPIDLSQFSLPPTGPRLVEPPAEPPDMSASRSEDIAQIWAMATQASAPPTPPAPAPPVLVSPPSPVVQGDAAADAGRSDRSPVADVFAMLLAAEQGRPHDAAVLERWRSAPAAITDDVVEAITRRVIERLGPDAVRHVVADVVADVAERLVREEIGRIRTKAAGVENAEPPADYNGSE